MKMLKQKIIQKLVTNRYKIMPPLEVAQYFEKLDTDAKILVTDALLRNDNTVAKQKIMEYMIQELSPIIDQYIEVGSIPTPIVEELLS